MDGKRKLTLFLLLIILIIVSFSNLQAIAQPAQEYLDYSQPEQVSQPNLFWELVKVVFSLILVLGMAYLIFQFLGKRNSFFMRGEFIKVIENNLIAPNKSISIVEVGNRFLILGITEQNISLLTEITDNQIINLLKEKRQRESDNQPTDSFANHLAGFLGKLNSITLTKQSENSMSELNNLENYFNKQIGKIKDSSLQGKKEGAEKDELR